MIGGAIRGRGVVVRGAAWWVGEGNGAARTGQGGETMATSAAAATAAVVASAATSAAAGTTRRTAQIYDENIVNDGKAQRVGDEHEKGEVEEEEEEEEEDEEESVPLHPIYRFVVTGGPCAGKTTCLSRMSQFLRARGFSVYSVPEAATLLFSNGASQFTDETSEETGVSGLD